MAKVKEKQNRRRIEILEAAIPIIAQGSFEEIGISDICREIGISIGSFYHYFTKKDDLLVGLLWIIDADLEETTFPRLHCENEIDNLKLFARGWAEHVASHGIERSKLISSINPDSADFPEHERPAVKKLREIITAGQEKGQITADFDAETLADLFLTTLRGITLDWSRREGSYPLYERMDRDTGFLLRAFLPTRK